MASFAAAAQEAKLRLDHLNHLAGNATETIEVSLDQQALRFLAKLASLSGRDKDRLENSVTKLTGVYVRGYEFENEGQYSSGDVEAIRNQMRSNWTRIAKVGGRNGSNDEVYMKYGNDGIAAYTLLSTKPKNICVINVVGQMNLDEIELFNREFDISNCGKWRDRRKSKS